MFVKILKKILEALKVTITDTAKQLAQHVIFRRFSDRFFRLQPARAY